MWKYVSVSDLIMNGGAGCTVIKKRPDNDHLTIYENECRNAGRGEVSVFHYSDLLLTRCMTPAKYGDYKPKTLTVGDLNHSRETLLDRKLGCRSCKHFHHGCEKYLDTWKTYKNDKCNEFAI